MPPRRCTHEGRATRVRDRPRRGRVAVRAGPRGRVLRDRRAADAAPDPGERDPGRDPIDRGLRAGRHHQGVLQPERPAEARANRVSPRERPRADHRPSSEDRKRHVKILEAVPIQRTTQHIEPAVRAPHHLHSRFRAELVSLGQFSEPNGDRYARYSLDAADPTFVSSIRPTPRALVILVDASGSMGFLDRWTLARDAVRGIVSDLRPGESYGIAVFQGANVAPSSPDLQPWTPAGEADLVRFLDSFRPHGSTGLAAPLAQAAVWAADARRAGQRPILVLVSDGRPTRP